MSIQAVNWAIETRVGDPILKILLITLANLANGDDETWHNQIKIAFDTEISVRTLRRRLHELVELGLISMEERRRENGTKTSSLITLLRHPPANLAAGTSGQKEGSPAATKVAGHRTVKNRKEDSTYGEDFEALWQLYPRTRNTSKKKAHDLWRMLNDENREKVRVAVPIFAAAMRAEGRTEDKIKHFQFFLSERVYETVSAAPAAAGQLKQIASPDWYKTATRDQWMRLLVIWRSDMNWRPAWGPAPGRPGCGVPIDLLTADEISLGSQNRVAERKALPAV